MPGLDVEFLSYRSNAIRTIDNDMNYIIIYCTTCVRYDRNLTSKTGKDKTRGADMRIKRGTDMRIKRGADMRIKREADMRIKRRVDMRIKRGADMRIKRGTDMRIKRGRI